MEKEPVLKSNIYFECICIYVYAEPSWAKPSRADSKQNKAKCYQMNHMNAFTYINKHKTMKYSTEIRTLVATESKV